MMMYSSFRQAMNHYLRKTTIKTGARAKQTAVTANHWQNWNQVVQCYPAQIVTATSEQEIQHAINLATTNKLTLRVAGAGHSFGPVVATDGVLLIPKLEADIKIHGNLVMVPAGLRLSEIFEPMWLNGLSLINMGELDTTTLTGAIATGVHGTGLQLPSISASLQSARLVTAGGEVMELNAGTELMQAAKVSMGMLGIMSEVTIKTIPAYDLVEKCYYLSVDEAMEEWDEVLHCNRHFNFYYLPNTKATSTYSDIFPPTPPGTDGEICFTQIRNAVEPGQPYIDDSNLERRDRMNRILTYTYPTSYREIEFAIPLEQAKTVFNKIRKRLKTLHPEYAQPVDVRFLAQDDALLSWSHDGPKAIFSIPDSVDCNYQSVLASLEDLFYQHGGLPHWGKEHRLTKQRLKSLNRNFDRFCQIRRELDPKGQFLNDQLGKLFA